MILEDEEEIKQMADTLTRFVKGFDDEIRLGPTFEIIYESLIMDGFNNDDIDEIITAIKEAKQEENYPGKKAH